MIEQTINEEFPQAKLEEKQTLKEELNLVREVTPSPTGKPSAARMLLPKIAGSVKGAYWTSVDTTKALGSGAWHMISSVLNSTRNTMMTLADGVHRYKQFADASNQATNAFLASTYTAIAHQAPGIVGDGLVAFGNGVTSVVQTAGRTTTAITSGVGHGVKPVQTLVSDTAHYVGEVAVQGKEAAADSLQTPKDVAFRFGDWVSYSTVSFGEIVLDKEPTRIFEVKTEQATGKSIVVTWKTNHLATSKVNYGITLDYGQDVQTSKKVHDHRLEVTGLKPNTKYFYEVMSQNKNYVYDAHHEFTTLTITR